MTKFMLAGLAVLAVTGTTFAADLNPPVPVPPQVQSCAESKCATTARPTEVPYVVVVRPRIIVAPPKVEYMPQPQVRVPQIDPCGEAVPAPGPECVPVPKQRSSSLEPGAQQEGPGWATVVACLARLGVGPREVFSRLHQDGTYHAILRPVAMHRLETRGLLGEAHACVEPMVDLQQLDRAPTGTGYSRHPGAYVRPAVDWQRLDID